MPLREIITDSTEELAAELASMDIDPGGVGIMTSKAFSHRIRVRKLKSPAANILKQEMLSVGGDCATSRTVILGDETPQDVLMMGTRRQLAAVAKKLKSQPFGLKKLASEIVLFLSRTGKDEAAGRETLTAIVSGAPLPLLMGIVNVTQDSFSDGGQFVAPEAAVAHALDLEKQGADILDIGGESTRPGSEPMSAEQESGRVVPVITELAAKAAAPISIDTMKSPVAAAALDAGAQVVNDVSAGRFDGEMFALVADRGCPLILMHMLGQPKTMQNEPHYDNLMDELHRFFEDRISAALKAGVSESQLIIDPGIGFGKSMIHNYIILNRLRELLSFGRPVLVGVSRKSLLKNKLGKAPADRLEETITAQTVAVMNGATVLRVHDVLPAVKSRAILQRTLGTP